MNLVDVITLYSGGSGSGPTAPCPQCGPHGTGTNDIRDRLQQNMNVMSRTSQGISRGVDRPALTKEGGDLAKTAQTNFTRATDWVLEHKSDAISSGKQAKDLMVNLNNMVNQGLTKTGQSPWRTWENDKYTSVATMQSELDNFSQQLSTKLQGKEDPVATAAWVEKTFETIHPFADGVGRTTMLLAAYVLTRSGHPLPEYKDRKEYFQQMNTGDWEKYYKGLFQ